MSSDLPPNDQPARKPVAGSDPTPPLRAAKATPTALWTIDPALNFTCIRRRSAAAGFPAEDLVGRNLRDWLQTTDDEHPLVRACRDALAGEPLELDFDHAGRQLWVILTPLQSPSGATIGCLAEATQIAALSLPPPPRVSAPPAGAETILAAAAPTVLHDRDSDPAAETSRSGLINRPSLDLQLFVERVPIGYVVSDESFRFIRWNPAAERIFGWTQAEILGQHPFDTIVPGDQFEYVAEVLLRLREGELQIVVQYDNTTKDDRRITCEWIHTPIYNSSGEFAGIVSMVQEETDRVAMQKSLETSEAQYRTIVETAHEGIGSIAADGTIRFANRRLAEILGVQVKDLIGQPLARYFGESYAFTDLEALEAHLHKQNGPGDFALRRADGAVVWAMIFSSPIALGDERGLLLVVNDVTDRRALEARFLQSQKMEAVGRLAGGIAHDFNNILTVVVGYSELILETLPHNSPLRELVVEIRSASERATGLTQQMLAFSRQSVMAPKIVDLNAVIAEADRLVRRVIGEDIECQTSLAEDLAPVRVDPSKLHQVILNLVVNARDAMPQGGMLTIETKNVHLDASFASLFPDVVPGPHALIAVSDTGIGMTPEVVAKIFEPFFTTKKLGKGTGLGLSTVYGIVKQSDGHITVYSEQGVGSTFKIYLPIAAGEVAEEPQAAPAPRRSAHETVLLVEDEASVRELVTRMLESAGYQVLTAGDGESALAMASTHDGPIDLLITDVVMPRMSGRELAETMQSQIPALKVLFMSGYTDDAIICHGILEADVMFLQKPFSPDTFLDKVNELFEGRG